MSVAFKVQQSCQPRLIILPCPNTFSFSTSTTLALTCLSTLISTLKPLLLHHSIIKQSRMGTKNTQNWDEPGLVKDLLAATVNHLNPSKQDMLQIANKAKAMGD